MAISATVVIGGGSAPSPPTYDNIPNQFTFTDVTNQPLGSVITSNEVTITGMDAPLTNSSFLTEDFSSSPLVSPWYDTLDFSSVQIPGGGTNDLSYYYKWINGTPTPSRTAARAQFTPISEFLMEFDLATTMNGGHIWYFKPDSASAYQAPTAGGAFYVEVGNNGVMLIDNRDSAGSWNSSKAGSISVNDGVTRRIKVYCKLNDEGSNDGIVRVWVDGVLDIEILTWRFITSPGEQINQILLGPYLDSPNTGTVELWVSNLNLYTQAVDANVYAPIVISGGTYSINGGAYTATAGVIYGGDTLQLRQTSSNSVSTTTNVVVNINGVVDTWSVTTQVAVDPPVDPPQPPIGDPYAALNQLYVNQSHANAADSPGNGSESNPWATVDYPIQNNLLAAGDCLNIVNFANTGVELYNLTSASPNSPQQPTVRVRSSGTASNPIVIRAKWGQYRMVRIEGAGILFGNHSEYASSQENIRFAGLVLHSTGNGGSTAAQAMASPFTFGGGNKGGIYVEYCELIGYGTYDINDNAQLLFMQSAGSQSNPVVIRHNVFKDHTKIGDDTHGGAGIRGYHNSTAQIYNNTFQDTSVGIDFKSGAGVGSYIAKNIFKRIKKKVIGLSHAGGGTSTVNLDVYQNMYIGPPHNTPFPVNAPFIFLNNNTGTLNSLRVFNNTLSDAYEVFFTPTNGGLLANSIEYFNNIRTRAAGSGWDAVIDTSGVNFSTLVGYADYNCNWSPTTFDVKPGVWVGYDQNSVVGNPLFTDVATENYKLGANSPCLASGIDRAQLLGGSASAPINMGAYILPGQTDLIGEDWADPVIPAAGSYFVEPTGDDGGLGTLSDPWKTISYGVTQLTPGDILYVKNGTYTDSQWDSDLSRHALRITVSGTAVDRITIKNYPGHNPIIDRGNGASTVGVIVRGSYITIDGIEIKNCAGGFGIMLRGSGTNNTIQNCEIHHISLPSNDNCYGVSLHGVYDATITGNTIYTISAAGNTRADDTSGVGFYDAYGLTITNNEFYDCRQAVYLKRANPALTDGPVITGNTIHDVYEAFRVAIAGGGNPPHVNVVMSDNLIYDATQGINCWETTSSPMPGTTITGNTIVTTGSGIIIQKHTGVTLRDNIIDSGGYAVHVLDAVTTFTDIDYNCYASQLNGEGTVYSTIAGWRTYTGDDLNSIYADPLFVNKAADDYTLQAGSPCISAASDGGTIGARAA